LNKIKKEKKRERLEPFLVHSHHYGLPKQDLPVNHHSS